jgi:chromosome segregation ATPase
MRDLLEDAEKECEQLRYDNAKLVNEIGQLRTERDFMAAQVNDLAAQLDEIGDYNEALIVRGAQIARRADEITAERDDLAAKLAAAQEELHDLRIRAGLGLDVPALVERLLDEAQAEDMAYICMVGPSRRRFMRRLREELPPT